MSDITDNLFTIANNIHRPSYYFRIEKGQIKINNLFQQWYAYYFDSTEQIQHLLDQHRESLSRIDRKCLQNDRLFTAVQKYNQAVSRSKEQPILGQKALANRCKLQLIDNPKIAEWNPAKIKVSDLPIPEELTHDKPEIVKEKRMFFQHNIRRYPNDRIDHSEEAGRIFFSTLRERILSTIGKIVEAASSFFGSQVTYFQKYHYRKNKETDQKIYAPSLTSPLAHTDEPTSYWLGHASLFLGIPLKSDKGSTSPFYVITDPVEGDLHNLLYPRQTRIGKPIDEMPAPHVYLLSHNHLDHYSEETIKKLLSQQPVMLVPKGDKSRLDAVAKKLGFATHNIYELDWWEKKEIAFTKNGERFQMQISATPSRHWTGQGPCGGHESTFLGYVISGHEKGDIYFAGDTARLNEDHLSKLSSEFNIRWNFQPGGPDEVRKDMESTHQSSVDGMWAHMKLLLPKIYREGMEKEEFLKRAKERKCIYMHTMTFKLGNLHLSDTQESVEKVLLALQGKKVELKNYEQQVADELKGMREKLLFARGEKLTDGELAQLLLEVVIVPKIGSRIHLETSKYEQVGQTFF